MCLVSGSLQRIFEVFENDIFDCKILWLVGDGEIQGNSVAFFVL